MDALELRSLERRFAPEAKNDPSPVDLVVDKQETYIAWEHRTVRLEMVEQDCGSFDNQAAAGYSHSQQELPFFEKIAIALRTCQERCGHLDRTSREAVAGDIEVHRMPMVLV